MRSNGGARAGWLPCVLLLAGCCDQAVLERCRAEAAQRQQLVAQPAVAAANGPMRFKVKKATKGWMVWDEQSRMIAVVDHYRAIGLSAETANHFARLLNKRHAEATSSAR